MAKVNNSKVRSVLPLFLPIDEDASTSIQPVHPGLPSSVFSGDGMANTISLSCRYLKPHHVLALQFVLLMCFSVFELTGMDPK